jgi:RimJ/RimL family protein N-acetyltransferase
MARKGDAKGVVIFWNDALKSGHLKYTGNNRRRGKADIKKFDERYSKRKRGSFSFLAINKEGRIIGASSFDSGRHGRTRHRGEVGWSVHQDYLRKGIGTKLLKAMLKEAKKRGFKKVEAEAAVENTASVRLAKKLGFKIEGRKKVGLILDNGKYVDTYIFGKILR